MSLRRVLCWLGAHAWERLGSGLIGPDIWRCRRCRAWDVDE